MEKTEIDAGCFIGRLDIAASKFYNWRERYGKVNEHNGWVPRDFWLEDEHTFPTNRRVLEQESENSVPSSLDAKVAGWLVGHLCMKGISIWAVVANRKAHCVESLAG